VGGRVGGWVGGWEDHLDVKWDGGKGEDVRVGAEVVSCVGTLPLVASFTLL
jgi:hypothetical protein